MQWEDLPETIDAWAIKAAAPAADVRKAVSSVLTSSHVGFYYNPVSEKVGIYAPLVCDSDLARVKSAACRAVGHDAVDLSFSYQQLSDPDTTWVKVAYSPTLRRAGELLNFFPGQYSEGIPNKPSPVAAMLTSGLLGAGLGWGGGKVLEHVMPNGYGKKLSRTGMLLGGALGAMPGLAWGGTNKLTGRTFNDPSLLNGEAGEEPENYLNASNGSNGDIPPEQLDSHSLEMLQNTANRIRNSPVSKIKIGEDLVGVELCEMYKSAAAKYASTFGVPDRHEGLSTDVNLNALGHTLWETGASPGLAATTMAGMYAAHQMPDPDSRPGVVTGRQLAQLTANTVGDYGKGYLVGAAINAAIGTPFRNSTFGVGNVALGVLGAIVPKFFGG